MYVGFKSDLNDNGFMSIAKEHHETSLQFAEKELGQEGVKDLEERLFVLRLLTTLWDRRLGQGCQSVFDVPCSNTPDLIKRVVITTIHSNQVCWSRETSITCRTAALEDRGLTPLL